MHDASWIKQPLGHSEDSPIPRGAGCGWSPAAGHLCQLPAIINNSVTIALWMPLGTFGHSWGLQGGGEAGWMLQSPIQA